MRLFQSSRLPGRRRAGSAVDNPDRWRRALHAALRGDLDDVEAQLSAVVQSDSTDVSAFLALGRVGREQGEVRRAVGIHQALVLRPDLSPAERATSLCELGESLLAAGDPRRAIAAFEEVVLHDRRYLAALRGLETALRAIGDGPAALVAMRRRTRAEGHRDRPAEARLLAEIARAAHRRGQPDVARRNLRRALRRDANCVDALALSGEIAAATGRDKKAIQAWQHAVQMDPSRGYAILPELAAAQARLGREAEWIDWLRGRIEAEPDDGAAWLALGRALQASADPEAAVEELRRTLRGRPHDLPGLVAIGGVLSNAAGSVGGADLAKAYAELLAELEGRLVADAASEDA